MSASPMQPLQIDLRFQGRNKLLLVEESDFVIGRSTKLKVCVESHNISREHLRVQILNGKIWITDLSSTNGTYLANKRLQAQVSVEYKGEELCIGPLGEGVQMRLSFGNEAKASHSTPSASPIPVAKPLSSDITDVSVHPARAIPTAQPSSKRGEAVPAARPLPKPAAAPRKHEVSSTGISVDSNFLVDQSLSPLPQGSPGMYDQKVGGQEFDPYAIEAGSKREQLIELEKKRLAAEKNLSDLYRELQRVKESTEATLRLAEEKRREHHEHEQELHYFRTQIEEAKSLIASLTSDEKRLRDSAASAQRHAEEMLKRRDDFEQTYRAEEKRVNGLRDALVGRESEYNRRIVEVHAELEKLHAESDFIRKRVKMETDTLQAEAQLRKAQVEKEVEELRGKKAAVERELESLVVRNEQIQAGIQDRIQAGEEIDQENQKVLTQVNDLKMQVIHLENRRKQLEGETHNLADRLQAAHGECQRILTLARATADETTRRAAEDAARLVEEGLKQVSEARAKSEDELRALREETERELRDRQQKLLDDIAEDRREAAEEIERSRATWREEFEKLSAEARRKHDEAVAQLERDRRDTQERIERERAQWELDFANEKQRARAEHEATVGDIARDRQQAIDQFEKERAHWEQDFAEKRQKAQKEHEAATRAWRSEMEATRQKDIESLSIWRAEQDKRVQEKFLGDVNSLIHAVATATLTKLQSHPNQLLTRTELLNTLEPQLREALTTETSTHGPFNPNLKTQAKKFYVHIAKRAVAVAAVVAALWFGPGIINQTYSQLKANRGTASDSSDMFVKRLKEARAKALELNLVPRPEFQATYTDNVLYNDAYLEIKQDPGVQKEWVIRLYQFFFEVLQMPDRVVVDYIPAEGGLIRTLADLRKTMNSRNFKLNLEQMKSTEKKKLEEEVFPLLGGSIGKEAGKKAWLRLRQLEAEFYAEKAKALADRHEARALATDGSEPNGNQ